MKHPQFLAGLRDLLRTEVMKASKLTITTLKNYATELEAINQNYTLTPPTRGH